jgi:hypothetical protein
MNALRIPALSALPLLMCGCIAITPKEVKYVQASDVINELKDELAQIEAQPASVAVIVPSDACGVMQNGQRIVKVVAKFDTADIVLKTIATDATSAFGSVAKLPLGSVLLGGSFTYTHTDIKTQQSTYSLLHVDEPDLLSAIPTDSSQTNKPFVPASGGYIPIYKVGSPTPITTLGGTAPEGVPPHHQIADAILAARDQILAVDHARKPCVLPKQIKVEIDFQIQEKTDSKGDVGFLTFLDFGSETVRQREFAQSMIVTFSLVGSSEALTGM